MQAIIALYRSGSCPFVAHEDSEVQKADASKVVILRQSRQPKEYESETNVDLEVCE